MPIIWVRSFNELQILLLKAGAALCVVCHPLDIVVVGKALQEDKLRICMHHEYFHKDIQFEQERNSFQQVTKCAHVRTGVPWRIMHIT